MVWECSTMSGRKKWEKWFEEGFKKMRVKGVASKTNTRTETLSSVHFQCAVRFAIAVLYPSCGAADLAPHWKQNACKRFGFQRKPLSFLLLTLLLANFFLIFFCRWWSPLGFKISLHLIFLHGCITCWISRACQTCACQQQTSSKLAPVHLVICWAGELPLGI